MNSKGQALWGTLEKDLEILTGEYGKEIIAEIRPIIYENCKLGKASKYIKKQAITSAQYLHHVISIYQQWHDVVYRLRIVHDDELWDQWYERLYKHTLKRLISLRGYAFDNEDVARSCVHRAAIVIVNPSKHYPYHYNFEAWIWRVLSNFFCKGAREANTKQSLIERNAYSLENWIVEVVSDPNATLRESDFLLTEQIRYAINLLPPHDQTLITYRYYEDRPFKEISMLTNHSLHSVHSRHARAKKKLRQLIDI